MCTPTAVLGMSAAGAASQTVGSFYAAKSQRDQMRLQADMADVQARQALLAGEREQQRSRLATANLKSRQTVAMAANGVALDSGTPNAVLTSTDVMGEIDANTIEQNALAQAWGYRTQAGMDRARANAINPGMSAATTLLGSATQVASTWYGMKKAGALDPAPTPYTGVW
ncbi:MAG: hypothetical protein KA324_13645 [Rubrivivax sp.]|nr:hypothetical protein [Rubrivivax sp.]MBP6504506.1 hypothetical protein [Rhodoferax sp.]MCH9837527.1 hypothetical protein [bacterium]